MYLSKGYKGVYDLYFTNPASGKRTKTSTGQTNYREAVKFRERFQIDDLLNRKSKIVNLIQLRDDVLEYARYNYSPKTVEAYRLSLNNFIAIHGNRQLSLIGMRDFEKFKNERSNQVTKTTVNIELRTLKAIFNYAVINGFIKTNPAKDVKQFILPEKEKLSFSDEELSSLFEVISDQMIKKIVMFGLYTGCRLAEILNVQIKDINFDNQTIIIRNKPNFKTKTGRIRQIPLSNHLLGITNESALCGKEEYLFSFDGNRLNKDFVSHKFKKYLRRAGLPERFHFHCLRHTFITNLIKNGVNVNFVKELAGHSDIQTTMGYIHIGVEDLRLAVNANKIAI